jgi:hypothetical protein
MPSVLLGNTSSKTPAPGVAVNGEGESTPLEGKTILHIDTPDFDAYDKPISLDKQLGEVRFAFGIHSDGGPAWVEGGDAFFAQAVARSFNCPIGRPTDWDDQPSEDKVSDEGAAKATNVELTIEDKCE